MHTSSLKKDRIKFNGEKNCRANGIATMNTAVTSPFFGNAFSALLRIVKSNVQGS
jgi:hypothetical protein